MKTLISSFCCFAETDILNCFKGNQSHEGILPVRIHSPMHRAASSMLGRSSACRNSMFRACVKDLSTVRSNLERTSSLCGMISACTNIRRQRIRKAGMHRCQGVLCGYQFVAENKCAVSIDYHE